MARPECEIERGEYWYFLEGEGEGERGRGLWRKGSWRRESREGRLEQLWVQFYGCRELGVGRREEWKGSFIGPGVALSR